MNEPLTPGPPPPPPPVGRPGCLAYGGLVALALWALALVGLGQAGLWLYGQILVAEGGEWPGLADALITVGQALLVAAPAALFVAAARDAARLRACAAALLLA